MPNITAPWVQCLFDWPCSIGVVLKFYFPTLWNWQLSFGPPAPVCEMWKWKGWGAWRVTPRKHPLLLLSPSTLMWCVWILSALDKRWDWPLSLEDISKLLEGCCWLWRDHGNRNVLYWNQPWLSVIWHLPLRKRSPLNCSRVHTWLNLPTQPSHSFLPTHPDL